MDRKLFRGILKKYLQSRATPEEEDMIDTWYAEMGDDRDIPPRESVDSDLERKYWLSIHSHIRKNKVRSLIPWKTISIAASIIIAALASLYLIIPKEAGKNTLVHTPAALEWEEMFNSGTSARQIALADGSSISLEPRSHIKFPSTFSDAERQVFLEGEAFFEVARNESRPFVVHTNQLTTKVLGTSFRISAYSQSKNVTVAVKTGKVSVSTRDDVKSDLSQTGEIILTPNQQIVFDKEKNILSRMIVEEPQPILAADEIRNMRFEASPVTEIFQAIEKVYGVDLVFDDEKFSSCTLTSVISDGDLYNRLDIICKAIGATYSIKENQIVIDGTGCDFQ